MTNIKKNNCGRPAGRIKTAKIEISIEPTVKTASVEIGLWTREYIKNNKLGEEE